MKTLYEQQWFINSVNWLRKHSDFFEKYGYGKSQNVEDFIRNPFEVLCYDSPNDGEIHGLYDVKFFTKNNGATRIQAYSPIYIMNDQGRTVETI
jgi:hypothetical protein